jgi:hypothetical protein
MKVKTILSIVLVVLLAGSVGFNVWSSVRLYSLQKSQEEMEKGQEDRDVALGALYETAMFMAEKFDELDAIFVEYDNLVSELDDLFREDCYSYTPDATFRLYESIASRYQELAASYSILIDDVEDFGERLQQEFTDVEFAF